MNILEMRPLTAATLCMGLKLVEAAAARDYNDFLEIIHYIHKQKIIASMEARKMGVSSELG